ncbi:MAG: bifunctional diguanylate cyclase/phosphodiesterase, partial [Pseudomonadales bacterium]
TLRNLAQSKEEINRQNKELRFLATRDPLTRCYNRRAMFEKMEDFFAASRADGSPLCVVMVDIDHFKSFNDKYGHAAGDKVIRFVADVMRNTCRKTEVVARYGGEEFCIILPHSTEDEAAATAERVRAAVTTQFEEKFTAGRDLTVSLGIASMTDHNDDMTSFIHRADEALYAAKHNGRNQVCVWNEDMANGEAEEAHDASQLLSIDQSMLVQVLDDPAATMTYVGLNERLTAKGDMADDDSATAHRKHGFDGLTGLPKRVLFYDRVQQALSGAQRDGQSVAVLYLDLDLRQRVGNSMEPVISDPALKASSERLATALHEAQRQSTLLSQNEEATISRLGNNEFGIVLPDLTDNEAATWIVQNIFAALDEPIAADDKHVYANCSIGISLYPTDGEDVETLLGRASQVRHLAHANEGRHTYLFYSADQNARSFQQIKLETQLRDALKNDELMLYFQPTYDLQTGKIVAFESLMRWNNPDMGIVGPAMFIHLAEQTGIIAEIGAWALRETCKQTKIWVDAGMADLRVAVNVSAVQLRMNGLQEIVLNILEDTGLAPKHLELELTETALMENMTLANTALQGLRGKGISVAMDDFGTGYSSLSLVKNIEVDKLKIDHSFVQDMLTDHRDAAVVSSIIAMAKQMGLKVVAEGIEDIDQLSFLKKHDCDMAQGFLLSRPLPNDKATALLEDQMQREHAPQSQSENEAPADANPNDTATMLATM